MASRFVIVQRCPPSWALYGLPKLKLNLHPTTTLLPKVSRGPIVRDLHSKHSTFRSFRGRGWNKIKSTKFHANQFTVSLISWLHIHGVWVFTHKSFMLSSLLGLRRPFLCGRNVAASIAQRWLLSVVFSFAMQTSHIIYLKRMRDLPNIHGEVKHESLVSTS